MSHSPGPWLLEIAPEFSGKNWLVASMGSAELDGKFVQVNVTTDHVHASEMEGDAIGDGHLVAAAPDLLEALQELLAAQERPDLYLRPERVKARSAIAKALGETR